MAIAIVSTGTGGGAVNSSGFDITLTIPDPGAVILAGICVDSVSNINPTATWDSSGASSALTMITERFSSAQYISAWYLINPTTGTHSITVASISTATVAKAGVAVAYSGVDSTTPYDVATLSADANVSGSSGLESTAVPSEVGDVVLSFCDVNSTVGSGILARNSGTVLGFSTISNNIGMAMAEWPGAATVNSTWGWGSTTGAANAHVTLNINAAAAGGASPSLRPSRRMMGMVGR